MAESVYNNAKNANTSHIFYKLNCGYHPCVFFEKNIDPYFQSKTVEKLSSKLRKLITVCRKNSTIFKSFKSKLSIKALSVKAMQRVIKFD